MPLQRPARPGGGLYSAECAALSEPAGSAPTRGRSCAAEPGVRVTAARVQGRGPEPRWQLERLAAPRVRRPTSRPFPGAARPAAPSRNLSQVDNSRDPSHPHGAPLPSSEQREPLQRRRGRSGGGGLAMRAARVA